MEITICKKVYLIEEVDDHLSEEELKEKVNEIIDETPLEDWDETNWNGQEVYEVSDNYSGLDLLTIIR